MLTPGKLLYHLWHRPAGAVRSSISQGGPWQERATEKGRAAMEAAAHLLPPPTCSHPGSPPITLHLLSGNRFWYQTVFCLWSFAHHSGRTLHPVVVDDGSLPPHAKETLQRLFPAGRLVIPEETRDRLETHLPAERFPALRDRWIHYPNIRKLTDVHPGSSGWKLVIDSDLLFFREPRFLLDWCDRPLLPLHAVDITTSYGYSQGLMESLCGQPLADRLNVGLCGLVSGSLDWEKLEYWTRTLIEREKTNYFLEQALVALLLAGQSCAIAPEKDYLTLPKPPEALECSAVMHHYVAESKRWYFQRNWQRFVNLPSSLQTTSP